MAESIILIGQKYGREKNKLAKKSEITVHQHRGSAKSLQNNMNH